MGGGAATALAALAASCGEGERPPPGQGTGRRQRQVPPSDIDIVNYLLLVESVELSLYAQVTAAEAVEEPGTAKLLRGILKTESQHFEALSSSLNRSGAVAIEPPAANFDAALESGTEEILSTAARIENVVAAAYLGQLPAVESPDTLATLLAIHSVEGRHAAVLARLAGQGLATDDALVGSIPTGAFAEPIDMEQALKELQPFLAR